MRNDYSYNGIEYKGDFAHEKYEWVWDWYSSSYYKISNNSTNPRGPEYGELHYSSGGRKGHEVPCRVIRGDVSRITSRGGLDPVEYDIAVGPLSIAFRVVRNAQ